MARKPRIGSRAWRETLLDDPAHAKQTIERLVAQVKQGDTEAAESVIRWLERFPELKGSVQELQDLATKAEGAWVRAVSTGNVLAEKAASDEAGQMKAEMLGPEPTIVERIVAASVVVAYLAYSRSAVSAAQRTDHPGVRDARERRLTAAQKRLLAAVKGWELIAGKKAKVLRAREAIKLFEPDPDANLSSAVGS